MITITKDKIYRSSFSLKKTRKESEDVEVVEIIDLICMLGDEVELGDDVTFREIFDIIIFHKEFLNILFNKEMGGFLIDDFINDYEKDYDMSFGEEGFNLRISWYSDVFEYNNEVEFVEYVGFEAFGKLNIKEDKEDYTISLAFVPLAEIRNKLITLNNVFELHDSESHKSDIGALFKANHKPFTLYDIFRAILTEITFYGNPEDRDAQRNELEEKAIEFANSLSDEELAESEFVLWEDIEEELKNMNQEDDFDTFWNYIYPNNESKIIPQDKIDSAIIAISDGSGLSLEEQLKEADESEDYERAAQLLKLIEKRDLNDNSK